MAFGVIYDACVLYPAALRDFLLRVARTGIVRARWSEKILDECFKAILRERPDLNPESLERTRRLMREAIPDCIVSGHENLIDSLTLPDPDDRHVLAAAIRSGAQTIVTFNLKDFPANALDPFGIEARHPDDFMVDQIGLAPGLVVGALLEQVAALRNPPMSRELVLDRLRDQGLIQTVAKLRELSGMG
ncbi:MAG: PIN domain-containing protein [Deltaproteobacteria bacterium]|nr:PIN domain-containing protein [Deltaproteobacteria bacterium]